MSGQQQVRRTLCRKRAPVIMILAALTLLFLAEGKTSVQSAPLLAGHHIPNSSQRAEERSRLFAALKRAPDEKSGREIESAIWRFWLRGSSPETSQIVRDAMSARDAYNFDKALKLLNKAVNRDPKFAEAWNQRAFIHFLKGNLEKSLSDTEKVLELEPKHFGALSGRAHIFLRQGRSLLMQKSLKKAVEIHPWLKERHMLPPDENKTRKTPLSPPPAKVPSERET